MVDNTYIDASGNFILNDDITVWPAEKVKEWLWQNGYKELVDKLSNTRVLLTGKSLLSLSIDDLQKPPFNLSDQHEREHLNSCIELLRKDQISKYIKRLENKERNCLHNSNNSKYQSYTKVEFGENDLFHKVNAANPLLTGEDESHSSRDCHTSLNPSYPSEKLKSALAFLYLFFGFIVSAVVLQLVHERVPSMTEDPPLPDLFFDAVPKRVEWAFDVCESIGIILFVISVIVVLFQKHRFIIARRIFFIMGTLYLYRSCTMFVTTLPVPGLHFRCAPKTNYKISLMLSRAAGLFYGGGLTVTGVHHLCGDYLFSGHTVVLVLAYNIIFEYSSKRWWWLHWSAWFLSALGILCILLAHDHYTVDVLVAYLLTTRLFWTYHSMCNTLALKKQSKSNLLSRVWWFPLFAYFELNVTSNGPLPCHFDWPFPWPRNVKRFQRFSPDIPRTL